MALAFIVVPAISFFVLGEPISLKLALGSLLIAAGLVVIYT
jgi:drug/metabolite transporter (DMT)-like permease